MNVRIHEVLPLLKGVKKNRDGWVALCPAHDDRRPSLSIAEKEDGTVLLHCFAGCTYERIVGALPALPERTPKSTSVTHAKKGGTNAKYDARRPLEKKEEMIPSAMYDYNDKGGHLIYQVVRYEQSTGSEGAEKTFRVRRKDEMGNWKFGLGDARTILYQLPDLLDADEVFVVEGEKDVDALRARGVVATCNPFGAGKWTAEFSQTLRNKDVVIWPDNDEPGELHAESVARSLSGIARSVRVSQIPGVQLKGDISDFLTSGGTIDELESVAADTPAWDDHKQTIQTTPKKRNLSFCPLPELLAEADEEHPFVWQGILPSFGFSICSAKPKVGKSTLARNLAAAVSTGSDFLGRSTVKGKVLCLFLEEKRSEIKRQFERMGVDSSNILVHTGPAVNSLDQLASIIIEHKAVLVIIDPISRVLRVNDLNEYAGVSQALAPLVDLARMTGAHFMALHHETKNDRSGGDGLIGSTAFFGSVDTNLQLKSAKQTRTLHSIQRYGDDIEGMTIVLDRETGRITTGGECAKLTELKIVDEIVSVLSEHDRLNESEIKQLVSGYNNGALAKALRVGVQDGVISRSGRGNKKEPYSYSVQKQPS